jgi:putative transposase
MLAWVFLMYAQLGISSTTFYKWRTKYGGMDTSMMARIKGARSGKCPAQEDVHRRKLKAVILNEAISKKWRGHLADMRWPNRQ